MKRTIFIIMVILGLMYGCGNSYQAYKTVNATFPNSKISQASDQMTFIVLTEGGTVLKVICYHTGKILRVNIEIEGSDLEEINKIITEAYSRR